ncbi:MAG: 50S ribosomal protein L11 [Candidatus Woesearchaeota archaeon]
MGKQSIDALINGGQASAAPPLGPALGPLGVNIGLVITEINKKTASFKGMQVPIKVTVDTDSKAFEISVGTPPSSGLLLKEAGIEKGSGKPQKDKVADILIEQVIKVAKMKEDALLGKTLKSKVKEIIGTANSLGILVEGMNAKDAIRAVEAGKFDAEISAEKTELTADELKKLQVEKKKLQEEVEKRHAEELKKATDIVESLKGKEKSIIKTRLHEAGISEDLIKKLLPSDVAAQAGEAKGKAASKK